jgi:hypothetical protein
MIFSALFSTLEDLLEELYFLKSLFWEGCSIVWFYEDLAEACVLDIGFVNGFIGLSGECPLIWIQIFDFIEIFVKFWRQQIDQSISPENSPFIIRHPQHLRKKKLFRMTSIFSTIFQGNFKEYSQVKFFFLSQAQNSWIIGYFETFLDG